MKIAFAGTPRFSVPSLAALIHAGYEIPIVYTQPDRVAGRGRRITISPVKKLAEDQGLPVRQPVTMAEEARFLRDSRSDLLAVVAYGMILPGDVLVAPRRGCINVHASILPRWRGAAPIQRAIEAGDVSTGVSIMQMEAGLDTGPVLHSMLTDILPTDTAGTVHDRLADLGAKALIRTIESIANGSANAVEQNDDYACYARKIEKREAELDWGEPAVSLERRVRAFNPWPVCWTSHGGNRIRIWGARIIGSTGDTAQPGVVEAIDSGNVIIRCGTGSLALTHLQRDGGKALGSDEFLRGYRISPGDQLGAARTASGHGDGNAAKK